MKYTYRSKTYKLKNKLKILLTILLAALISTTGYLISRDAYSNSADNGIVMVEEGSRTLILHVRADGIYLPNVEIYDENNNLLGVTGQDGKLAVAYDVFYHLTDSLSYIVIDNNTIYLDKENDSRYTFSYAIPLIGEAYAEFDSSNGKLRIFRDNPNTYTNGQTSGTKTYYTGIETITGNTNPKWYSQRSNITNVVIENYFRPKTAYFMFSDCTNLTAITGIEKLITSNVTNMGCMFRYCRNIINLDFTNFNTSNVINMSSMFDGCNSLTSLDLSNFDTSSVTDMSYMFDQCNSVIVLNVSSFDTSNVINMRSMFYQCSSLTNLNISNFDTTNVENMEYMFYSCDNLTNLDISNFNTSNTTNMGSMFSLCHNIISLNLSNFDTSGVTSISGMFYQCSSLTNLDLRNFNTTNVSNMSYMFFGCSNLTSLDLNNFNTNNVTNMGYMFFDCSNLTSLDLNNFNTNNVTDMTYMFLNTTKLNTIKLGTNWNFLSNNGLRNSWIRDGDTTIYTADELAANYNGATMAGTYRLVPEAYAEFDSATGILRIFRDSPNTYTNGQTSGTKTYYTGIETITGNTNPKWFSSRSNITSVVIEDGFRPQTTYYMFADCANLLTITGIENLDTSNVTTMSGMFFNCSSLTSLDLSSFNTSNVTNMFQMFSHCRNLVSIDVSSFNTSKVTNMGHMFYSCQNLITLDLSNFDTSKVTNMSYMFAISSTTTQTLQQIIGIENFDTSNVTDMSYMFNRCSGLTNIDVSNFDTSKVTNMTYMFGWCINMESIDVSNFDTSKVTNMAYMFAGSTVVGVTKLTAIIGINNFDTSQVTDMSHMFEGCGKLTNLNVSNFNTGNVTMFDSMFDNCVNLTSLDLSNFNTSNVTTMTNMFSNTTKLNTLKLGANWNFLSNNGLTKSWIRDGDTIIYSATELTNSYNGTTMAGTYRAVQQLTIAEQVKGSIADINKEFNFTINVENDGVGINTTHAYTGTKSGNLVFTNGVASFTLKHNDSISTYLPYGVSYTITQNSDGYTLSKSNGTGTLSSDKTATFTDTLNGTTPTGIFLDLIPFILLITFSILGIFLIRKFKYI